MNQDHIYQNLTRLLLLFQNRPHHLAKYLIDKCAFNDFFLKMVEESDKLNNPTETPFFRSVDEMNDYYDIFKENSKNNHNKKVEELFSKLQECLKEEKYEDAARLRDYMIKIGIKFDDLNK